MPTRVGDAPAQPTSLIQRLRSLTPPEAITYRAARQVAERQAKILLAETGVTEPPVPTDIVSQMPGIYVYPLPRNPVRGLLGASKPTSTGGDILIDGNLPAAEQRLTLLHELKHIIDGGHSPQLHQRGDRASGEQLCTEFALEVLIPSAWIRADWVAGMRGASALAERYEVPREAVQQRLHALGLSQHRPPRRAVACQWHPHRDLKRRPR